MLRFFLLGILLLSTTITFAHSNPSEFMTPRDLLSNDAAASNINLQNNRNLAATVYGLYVRQFSYVLPGNTCDQATVIYASTQNTAAGSVVMPTTISAGRSAAVGSNYLYNMIYQAMYYVNILFPSSPPGCALPGCTWGSDSTIYNWCVYLGALAPNNISTSYTSNVPPSTDSVSSASVYNYDLVNSYVYLGPISCNDQTLTCTAANQQTQSFS